MNRRDLFTAGTAAAITSLMTAERAWAESNMTGAAPFPGTADDYSFEVTRTLEQWKERLTLDEFFVLRSGGTEPRNSSPLRNEERAGAYYCKGCDLALYEAEHKIVLPYGWVFFFHSVPNSVLLNIDLADYGGGMPETAIAATCRRCGSHLGHVLVINGLLLHCINGTSLNFVPAAA